MVGICQRDRRTGRGERRRAIHRQGIRRGNVPAGDDIEITGDAIPHVNLGRHGIGHCHIGQGAGTGEGDRQGKAVTCVGEADGTVVPGYEGSRRGIGQYDCTAGIGDIAVGADV